MSKYIILGGRQKSFIDVHKTPEWKGYEKAIGVEVDIQKKEGKVVIEYITPPENRNETEDASILFKAGSVKDDRIITCTQTEILIYRIESYRLEKIISKKYFNDIHHVSYSKRGTLIVVATGLDAVFELDKEGNKIREWSAGETDIWERFDKNQDYRKILTTKPHRHHPNYCYETENGIWVTRFINRDSVCLSNGQIQKIAIGGPHDGVVFKDNIFFTTVNGKIVRFKKNALSPDKVFSLENPDKRGRALGWCRGIYIEDSDDFIVGFSRMRPTKYQEYLTWMKKTIKTDAYTGSLPTRIARYKNQRLIWELNLEYLGLNSVFSIHKINLIN